MVSLQLKEMGLRRKDAACSIVVAWTIASGCGLEVQMDAATRTRMMIAVRSETYLVFVSFVVRSP